MKDIKAIVFDWDGTLAETRPLVVAAMNKTLAHYQLPDWDIIKQDKRDPEKSLKDNFPNFFGDQSEEAYQFYLRQYRDSFDVLTACAGASDTLTYVSGRNLPLYIVSNKDKSLLTREITFLFPEIKFNAILGHGEAAFNKPHPAPLQKIAANNGLRPENILLVGDSKQDTACAYAAGCIPALIGQGQFMDADYIADKKRSTPPLLVFNDLTGFLQFLITQAPVVPSVRSDRG